MIAHGSVIGVDIGCSPKRRSSAICRLNWTETTIFWSIKRFRALEPERESTIAERVSGGEILAAAFDGSLRRGLDIIGHYRSAERLLTRRLGPLIGKPGQSSTPIGKLLNHHANVCVGHVLAHGAVSDAVHATSIHTKAVAEAFPSSFLGLMIADPAALAASRSDRSDVFFRHLTAVGTIQALLAHCLPGRRLEGDPEKIVNHDDRAAFICALTALCLVAGDYVAVGDVEDGWIILPPQRFIQPAQWHLLGLNAAEDVVGALHVTAIKSELEKWCRLGDSNT